MNRKIIGLMAAFLMALSSQGYAYGYLTSLGGNGVTIDRYFVHKNGGLSLLLKQNVPSNPDGCDVSNHVYIKGDNAGHELMKSAALAAFVAGKSIGLHGDGCELIPFWGGTQTRPTVSDLWVFEE